MLSLTGCGDGGPTGVPYDDLGRDVAGVYNPSTVPAQLNMRLVLGTRHNVTGRYDTASGEVRFYGTWTRNGDVMVVSLPGQPGMPAEIRFDITKEEILTEIVPGPFSMAPETAAPEYIRQNVMRLRAGALVAGTQVDINLIRIIVDRTGGGGGLTQS
jgi:hypothetical protein